MNARIRLRDAAATAGTLLVSLALMAAPCPAFASEGNGNLSDLQSNADELVTRIETTTTAYREAADSLAQIEDDISKSEERIAQIREELPAQRARTAASIKNLYIFQQSTDSILTLLLSADDFEDFIGTLRYMDAIHAHNTSEINALTSMEDELSQRLTGLVAQRDTAAEREEAARKALEEARSARVDLQQQAISIALNESDARDEAVAIAVKALEAADAASASLPEDQKVQATFTTSSGNTAVVEVPTTTSVTTDPLVTNTTSEETTDWASRINSYLEGSPLAGYGEVFAEAAATYGVDPRLSPAIATIESSQGEYCFKDHNAWGWGSSSWDSWEDAIYDQVEGLATGYDGTLTIEGAEKYCPPNYQEWYSSVASEMGTI